MERKKTYRYSEHFKLKVIEEVRRGNSNIKEIARDYGVSFGAIYSWLRKYKIQTPKHEVIFVDMAKKHSLEDQLKTLQKEILELKDVVSKLSIKLMKERSLRLAGEELTGLDFKKKVGTTQS